MLEKIGNQAKLAAHIMAKATIEQKNNAITMISDELWKKRKTILETNRLDVEDSEKTGLASSLIDRLLLNEERLSIIISDLRKIVELKDPVGETFDASNLPNGLRICKQRVPIGVLAVIYEARPNVTVDASGLAIKTGNSIILRGGSETIRTNNELISIIQKILKKTNLPIYAVQTIKKPDRKLVSELLKMHDVIDMLIPRGGQELHKYCRENSLIPVITGGIGICHLYVDETADLDASINVIRNAKIQRPTVCNALDTVLIHRSIADVFLPRLIKTLTKDGVLFKLDEIAWSIYLGRKKEFIGSIEKAKSDEFDIEWLSLVLGVKVVDNITQAIDHICLHSTGHSDGILTNDDENSKRFIAEVDSAAVYVNASTRFTDGSQFGLGTEVAISTQRLHARGPMGLRELTTYKWVIVGDYSIRK